MSEVSSISRFGSADRVDAVSTRIRRRWSLRQLLIALAAGLSLILAGLYGDYWWNTGRFLVTIDDAYVQVHSALIAPQLRAISLRCRSMTASGFTPGSS